MVKSNESNINLPSLFSKKVFRIPDYQRGYAWLDRQLTELWEDLEDIELVDGEYRNHFTGTISLKQIPSAEIPETDKWLSNNGFLFYDVVDGQQRLTTLAILLFELIKLWEEGYPDKKEELLKNYIYRDYSNVLRTYLFSYRETDNNHDFLLSDIFEDMNVPRDEKVNIYVNNLRHAKTFFKEKLEAMDLSGRVKLFSKVQTALVFDVKYIDDSVDVQAVFETMNNRGKPLTILERLKNRLYYLASKCSQSIGDNLSVNDVINKSWRIIYSQLGMSELNADKSQEAEDEFISAYLTVIRRPTYYSFSEKEAEKKIFEMFSNRAQNYPLHYSRSEVDDVEMEPKVTTEKIRNFARDIAVFVPNWCEVIKSDDHQLRKILCMSSSKEVKLFLAELLRLKEGNPVLAKECINLTEKLLFRNSIPGLYVMDERTFATKARDLHTGDKILDEVIAELKERLAEPCRPSNMISQFRNLFNYVRGNIGYHRWWGLRYFLMEYEEYLQKEMKEPTPHVSWDNFSEISIEHIMPKDYSKNWQAEMDEYKNNKKGLSVDDSSKSERILINTLGNLTILMQRKNASLQDNSWSDKKSRYTTGSYNEIEVSKVDEWNQDAIFDRGKKLLHFMESKIDGLHFNEQEIQDMLFGYEQYVAGISVNPVPVPEV